jgi:hypothetical protein
MAKHDGAVAIAVDAGPKRMLRIVPTLDGEPCGNPQMVAWAAGWDTDDILDELERQATTPRTDGTAWGIPGAERFVLRVTAETPDRIEINARGFTSAELGEAWIKRDHARRDKRRRELEEQRETRQREQERFDSTFRSLEQRMDQKMAELRDLVEEAGDFDAELARAAREFKLGQEARRDEKRADLLSRQRQLERELEDLRSQARALPTAA